MFSLGFSELVILPIILIIILGPIAPLWTIFKKAGFPGPLALTWLFVPALWVALCIVAYSEWPSERQLKELCATADTAAD